MIRRCAVTLLTAITLATSGASAEPAPEAPTGPASPAAADPTAALQAQLERIAALRRERPGDGLLVYYQAITEAALGRRDAALAGLRSLLGRRLGLLPIPDVGFETLWPDPEFQAIRERLYAAEPRTPDAPVVLQLADRGLIPEGIAYDARQHRFLVGSIARRQIVAVERSGRERVFAGGPDIRDPVLGLHVDPRRGELLAVSTNGFEDAARHVRRNAVLRYRLADGRLLQRLEAPEAQQLNDVVAAADGAVYATDSAAGRLFRALPGATALMPFGPAGSLRGANGLAVGPGGALFVATSTGIARVDPADGSVRLLPQPDDVVTGAIDGLYAHRGSLIGIQNATHPGRVVRIGLAADGRAITGLQVLQSHHHPMLDEPTTGVVVGRALVVIANSHVGRYGPDGQVRDPATLRRPALIAVPLNRQPR